MYIIKLSTEKQIVAGFVLMVAVLVFLAVLSYINSFRYQETSKMVAHTNEVLYHTEQILSSAIDVETGQRGYVITGDRAFLEPYEAGIARLSTHISKLRDLTKDNLLQQRRADTMQFLTDKRIKLLKVLVLSVSNDPKEKDTQISRSYESKSLLDKFRKVISRFQQQEKELLKIRAKENEREAISFHFTLGLIILFILFLLIATYLTVFRHITIQKEKERIIQSNWQMLQSILDCAPSVIYLKNLEGKFMIVNERFAHQFQCKPSDIVGKTCHDLLDEDAANKLVEKDKTVIETMMPLEFEETYDTTVGNPTMLTTKFPLKDENGNIYAICGILTDITERKKQEEALIQLNKELEAFSYSVSHDLRAPLRAIDGYSRILLEDYYNMVDDEGKKVINVIVRNAKRMGSLIDDLLAFSRVGRLGLNKKMHDMNEIVQSALNEFANGIDIALAKMTIQTLPNAKIDANMMRQVWINLIGNALKYSSKAEHPMIEIGYAKETNYDIYYVKDNGVGFDMQYSHKLFGVFQRLHTLEEFEGTGVGLAFVQRVIVKHDGKVWAEGQINQGATFFFSIPNT